MSPARLGFALALGGALGYGSVGVLSRLAVGAGFALLPLLAWRFTLSALLLAPIARLRQAPRGGLLACFAIGVCGFAVQSACYFFAVEQIGAGKAAVVLYTYPAMVLLLNWAMDRRQRPTQLQLLALGLSSIGCWMTAYDPSGHFTYVGTGFGLLTAFVYALYLLTSQRVIAWMPPLAASWGVSSGAAVAFWLIAVTGTGEISPAGGTAWMLLGGMALFSTVLPMLAVFGAVKRLGASTTALLSMAEPVFAVGLGALVLGETFDAWQLTGGALSISAAVMLMRKR